MVCMYMHVYKERYDIVDKQYDYFIRTFSVSDLKSIY